MSVVYQKWLTKLVGFDFEIEYKPRLENKAVNALSQKGLAATLMTVPSTIRIEEVIEAVKADQELGKIMATLKTDSSAYPGYTLVCGALLYKDWISLPKDSPFILMALQEGYDSKIGGYGGFLKTYKTIAKTFYWVGMKKDIRSYVTTCTTCQQHKYSTLAPAGLMQSLLVPEKVWEDISMDFIEGLLKSEGFDSILVVVDRLSKYAHFISLKHPFMAPSIATVFMRKVVRLHGIPQSIVSDRDKVFLSKFWT